MLTPPPKITFLISTYNRRDVLLRTLAELERLAADSSVVCETIVVDNASKDGTADSVEVRFPDITLLRRKSNRGACAKNAGLRIARGEYVVFLDDDSFPTPGTIERMIKHFEADPMLGAAVFDIVLPDGSHECSAYPSVFIGCGTGFRRSALLQAGGLPDDFFMQAEEYDLSLRLMDAGWKVERFADLVARHLKTPGARVSVRTTRMDVRNNLTLIFRRFPRRYVLPFAIAWMRRYRWIAMSKGRGHHLAFWRGLIDGLARGIRVDRRRPVSDETLHAFLTTESIDRDMIAAQEAGHSTVLLLDLGKNAISYISAARRYGLKVVAIADDRLSEAGRSFCGVPVVHGDRARRLVCDVTLVANSSPIHAHRRRETWSNARTILHEPAARAA